MLFIVCSLRQLSEKRPARDARNAPAGNLGQRRRQGQRKRPTPHVSRHGGRLMDVAGMQANGLQDLMARRHSIGLTPDEQRRFLADSHTVILSSMDRHGYPHSVAMWYAVEPDGAVVMTTFAKSQKTVNLRRDPRCALLLESGRTYETLKGLLIRGRATLDSDVEHVLDVLGLVHEKYAMPGHGAELREALRAQARKRVAIRIRPERVASWDHAKLAGVY
jgi:PPOX class probable F420-dependent enzyme